MHAFAHALVVILADVPCDHNARAHRNADKQVDKEIYQRACRADGGESLLADESADHHHSAVLYAS